MLRPLGGIFIVIYFAVLVVTLFALVDASIRPARAYAAEGKQTKQFWVILLVVATLVAYIRLFTFLALIAALVYLLDVRPSVRSYR